MGVGDGGWGGMTLKSNDRDVGNCGGIGSPEIGMKWEASIILTGEKQKIYDDFI